ncbi:MAG: GrdX family protein [Eggerthellaceae bacterium]
MSYQFVTNNPRLIDKEGAIPVDGTFRDVLVKVRDMVHAGYELISHPLFASSRMMFSPYRTILMGGKMDAPRVEFIEIIENSIMSYDNAMARRRRQPEHDDDYAYVDESLFYSALEEIERLRP